MDKGELLIDYTTAISKHLSVGDTVSVEVRQDQFVRL